MGTGIGRYLHRRKAGASAIRTSGLTVVIAIVILLGGAEAAPAAVRSGVALPILSFRGKVILLASLIAVQVIVARRARR